MQFVNPFGTATLYIELVADQLRLDGDSAHGLFEGTNLAEKQLDANSERVDAQSLRRIYNNASQLSSRDDFNLHMGKRLQLSTHGAVGYAMQTAPDLLNALQILVSFSSIREDFLRYRLERLRGGITLVLESARPSDPVSQPMMEMMLSMTCHLIESLIGDTPNGMSVNAAFPAPAYKTLYRQYFSCPVKFSANRNEVVVLGASLHSPCLQSDPQLHVDAIAECRLTYRQLNADLDISSRVQAVMELDETALSLPRVARHLGLSTRTLSRRLRQAETQFQQVKDDHLKRAAVRLLRVPNATIEDIGYRLGYDNAANFRRAFARWYKQTPSHYRRHLRSNRR